MSQHSLVFYGFTVTDWKDPAVEEDLPDPDHGDWQTHELALVNNYDLEHIS